MHLIIHIETKMVLSKFGLKYLETTLNKIINLLRDPASFKEAGNLGGEK